MAVATDAQYIVFAERWGRMYEEKKESQGQFAVPPLSDLADPAAAAPLVFG